jgi:hypothetical protein
MGEETNSCALRVLLRLDLSRLLAVSASFHENWFKSQKDDSLEALAENNKKPSASRRGNVVSSRSSAKQLVLNDIER